ncbi:MULTISPECIES: reverse transcriptase family protein [unclassified Empedobacter]|uniref:reverse transcriptase family protein n=1 Tax=unclassified Empedobacter TaxID=2643773 RepID=UPI0025BAFBAC|nr:MULTISPECIES: reverse transcriptase family protein [unclassified Empedobacter]
MKNSLTVAQITEIKENFLKIESLNDLCIVLNQTNELTQIKHTIEVEQLAKLSNPALAKNRYREFTIKKKSGADRKINAPISELNLILKSLNQLFNFIYTPHTNAFGFVAGKSIVDNAKMHTNKKYVYNIDLKDFFHSFDRNRVKMGIWYQLFEGDKSKEKISFILACLTTHPLMIEGETKIVLPQGSPTSPSLTNLLCYKLDRQLKGLAKRFKLTYSRYADDITFSSNYDVYSNPTFTLELNRIITAQNLMINQAKTRLQGNGYRKEVTGITINEYANVSQKYVKQLRMWIFFIEKYGIEKATEIFKKDYSKEKGHVKSMNASMLNVIEGKLLYLGMVRGKDDEKFLTLKNRFYKSIGKVSKIDKVLNAWEEAGISKAMDIYYNNKRISLTDFLDNDDINSILDIMGFDADDSNNKKNSNIIFTL